jgi:glycyl-tRNA synthetase beta chain
LIEPAEQTLATTLLAVQIKVAPLLKTNQFADALAAMAALQPPVDAFFEQVMVNVDDQAVRNNRLALLQQLRQLFLGIADISLLQNV